MAEVTIKAHTRRGKGGKSIQVRSYSRRIGKKGVYSPKKEKLNKAGEEYEKKILEKNKALNLTPEDIIKRMEVMEGFKRAEAERKSLGMSKERYSRYKSREQKKDKTPPLKTNMSTLSSKKSLGILKSIEDKIAKFVEKYSGKKYKRQL